MSFEFELIGLFGDAHGEIGVVDGEGGKRSRREHDGALFLALAHSDGLRRLCPHPEMIELRSLLLSD